MTTVNYDTIDVLFGMYSKKENWEAIPTKVILAMDRCESWSQQFNSESPYDGFSLTAINKIYNAKKTNQFVHSLKAQIEAWANDIEQSSFIDYKYLVPLSPKQIQSANRIYV